MPGGTNTRLTYAGENQDTGEMGMKGREGNIRRLERVLLRVRDRESKYLSDTRWDKYSLLQLIEEATAELIDSLVYMERLRDALVDGGDHSMPSAGSSSGEPHS